jgi:exopolysaccharide production protein ExoQ
MRKALTHSFELRQTGSSIPTIDKYAIVPVLACAYAAIIGPLMIFDVTPTQVTLTHMQNAEPGLPHRIFWPAMAAVSVVIAMRNYSRLSRLTWPPHMICLLAYVAFAGASVLWAFRPEASFVRFAQQLMLLSSIVLPAMLAARTADLMRGMFLCFAVGAILNVFFGYENPDGYSGYLMGKNTLGEFSGIALLLALHETFYPGLRRVFGIIFVVIATLLLLWSQSKTAYGLALFCPLLAGVILAIRKATRMSPAITLVSAVLCYAAVSSVSSFNMDGVATILYGDPTLTGRTFIWDFAFSEIARRPLFGWGYQSFWLVGTDAPSVFEAPGWIGSMPNAHNGYYDTMLELGYIGCGLLIVFILATIHLIGRVADRDGGRAWLLLSLALYVITYNCLETFWMHGSEPLWVVFVIVAAEIGRFSQPFPPVLAQRQPRNLVMRGPIHHRERSDTSYRQSE